MHYLDFCNVKVFENFQRNMLNPCKQHNVITSRMGELGSQKNIIDFNAQGFLAVFELTTVYLFIRAENLPIFDVALPRSVQHL